MENVLPTFSVPFPLPMNMLAVPLIKFTTNHVNVLVVVEITNSHVNRECASSKRARSGEVQLEIPRLRTNRGSADTTLAVIVAKTVAARCTRCADRAAAVNIRLPRVLLTVHTRQWRRTDHSPTAQVNAVRIVDATQSVRARRAGRSAAVNIRFILVHRPIEAMVRHQVSRHRRVHFAARKRPVIRGSSEV
jgi:hypothetical protein